MKKNKKTKYFFRTLYILLFIYIALIIAYESGYYETKSHNRAVLTKEAMERFESDLAQGQVIDVKDYLKEEKRYSARTSRPLNIGQSLPDNIQLSNVGQIHLNLL